MTVCLRRISKLPNGFQGLKADAVADGHRHMSRLATGLEMTPERFSDRVKKWSGCSGSPPESPRHHKVGAGAPFCSKVNYPLQEFFYGQSFTASPCS
jgi:hypothetical protein